MWNYKHISQRLIIDMSTFGLRRIITQQITFDCQENNLFDFQRLIDFFFWMTKKGDATRELFKDRN